MRYLLAQTPSSLGNLCGIGNIGLCDGAQQGISLFAAILSTAIGLLTVIAGIYFLFILIIGAIGIISAGGDKAAYEEAKKRLTNGAVGFVLTIAAIFILDIIAVLLGIPDILNIGEMINKIRLR